MTANVSVDTLVLSDYPDSALVKMTNAPGDRGDLLLKHHQSAISNDLEGRGVIFPTFNTLSEEDGLSLGDFIKVGGYIFTVVGGSFDEDDLEAVEDILGKDDYTGWGKPNGEIFMLKEVEFSHRVRSSEYTSTLSGGPFADYREMFFADGEPFEELTFHGDGGDLTRASESLRDWSDIKASDPYETYCVVLKTDGGCGFVIPGALSYTETFIIDSNSSNQIFSNIFNRLVSQGTEREGWKYSGENVLSLSFGYANPREKDDYIYSSEDEDDVYSADDYSDE